MNDGLIKLIMNPYYSNSSFLVLAVYFALSPFFQGHLLCAQRSDDPIVIRRVSAPVILDGLSNEAAWRDIQPLPVVTQSPTFGNPPSEKTEILIGFDDNFLYVAGRCYDREPDRIQSPSKKRDFAGSNTEWLGVLIDTFNDKENALAFYTTPSGLRWDAEIYNDGQPQSPADIPINRSWNAVWDAAAIVNGQGWFAELRIPLSSLRFQDRAGRVTAGLIAGRYIARKNEWIIFPAIEPKWGGWSSIKVSQAREVILEGVHSRNPIYVTPYVLGGVAKEYNRDAGGTVYLPSDTRAARAGLDIKYSIASNLTLDVTLNTDFAQVEADDYQVNLTRFSLLFPEKRLFFQERGGIFNFGLGADSQLFYSRRIGIHEGKSVPIYGGARLIGRFGFWDMGFLDMQTAPIDDCPSENFGVLRLRKRVFNSYSYVGAMVTTRIGTDGSYNAAYGVDGNLRIKGDNYILFNWAQTFENVQEKNPVSPDPTFLRIAWQRRTTKGLGLELAFSRAGKDFDPGTGFLARKNYEGFGNRILYGWLPGERSFLQSHAFFADGYIILRNEDGTIESMEIGPGWTFAAKSGWMGEFAVKTYRERLQESLSFSDETHPENADVPPGDYTFQGITGQLQSPAGSLLSTIITFYAGSFYDGWRVSVGMKPTWGISPDLSLSAFYQYNRADFPVRKHKYEAHIAQLRMEATLSLKFSANTFIQYDSGLDTVRANVQFRFNPREGHDLYLVYNQDFCTDRTNGALHLPLSNSRVVMLKYSYMFNF